MRNILILLIFSCILPVTAAKADSKLGQWLGWFPSHGEWDSYKKFNPYLENGKDPHPEQWDGDDWQTSDWVAQRKNGLTLVQGFYNADIIRNQAVENNTPVVTVGPNFYRLGGQDKRRVITSIDNVYGVTAQDPDGTILLRDWNTRMQIGFFTKHGLTIE